MIKIICDTEDQMKLLQTFMAESNDCPFASIDLPNGKGCIPDADGKCYLCVRGNIEWEVRHE